MSRTLVLGAPLLALVPGLQQTPDEPVMSIAGQSFQTWQDYVQSPLFRELRLRCGTGHRDSIQELRPTSDCSLSSTTILPQYDPTGNALYRIPVVVHVIESTGGQGQVSDALIFSQIDVLNEDFRAIAGTNGGNGTDARIEFFLATEDPGGSPTTGITHSANNTWFNDGGNYYDTLAWDTSRYLNIYTNQASGALGYVPDLPQGGIVGADADRVVVLWSAFGRNAPIGPPFDLGRTATHEVGHYLGLFHTFDFGCGSAGACYTTGDRICDTNQENSPVFGCPAQNVSCGTTDPIHNYMDYTDDICWEEFTPEQVNRMRCTLENWRVDLPDGGGCAASVASRTAGSNLNTYTATPPVLGGNMTMNISAPGRTEAILFGYAGPTNKAFPNGMVQLVDLNTAQYFKRTLSLPPGNLTLAIPANPALCGITAYTQAAMIGGGPGFDLSNALDLTAGF